MSTSGKNTGLTCRFCGTELRQSFVDLGMSPPCQTHVTKEQLNLMERFYPLHAFVCHACFLVQLGEYVSREEIFSDYAYFSSYVGALLKSASEYAEMMTRRFGLSEKSLVVELASNDGYLLQYFVKLGIPVLGIEPAANVAEEAKKKGIPTVVEFFGRNIAGALLAKGMSADVLLGNNVLAHVPDLNDFVAGMKILLKPRGVITMEFPHVMRLIDDNLFDTIYHEHFSYFSFSTAEKVFKAHGLVIFDVGEINIHGGSLRIFACHAEDTEKPLSDNVCRFRAREEQWGVSCLETYNAFGDKVRATKRSLLRFLIEAKEKGKTIAAYGAPGKATTLLNYCGIGPDFLDYTVDKNPHKQNKFIAGTHIPIFSPEKIRETRPDYLLILPWNLRDEIAEENSYIREWGGKFVVALPALEVF
jgi:2-polyprenyl-3-methyl-5-hydroxy-6-metoxy-1,4-benzoquinol methylase